LMHRKPIIGFRSILSGEKRGASDALRMTD
jgi:hypothetical protein